MLGIPLSGEPLCYPKLRSSCLRNEPTPEANGYGVGSAARLKLRQQMADVRLDRLL